MNHQAGWFIPDDALKHVEHPEECARRILNEQVGLDPTNLRLGHIESFVGNNGSWHLVFHLVWKPESVPRVTPSKEIASAEWFSLDSLPPRSEVAHNGWAIDVLRRIQHDLKFAPQATVSRSAQ